MEVDELDALRFADPAGRIAGPAAPGGRDELWWLGVVQHVTLRATGPGTPAAERRTWAELAVAALETALETGGLDDREVATREARLCLVLPAGDRPDSLRPDRVAGRCLALVGLSPAEVAATRWSLRAEDVPLMRKLRRVRNLVVPASTCRRRSRTKNSAANSPSGGRSCRPCRDRAEPGQWDSSSVLTSQNVREGRRDAGPDQARART